MQKVVLGKVGEYRIKRCDRDDVPTVMEINGKTLPEHYSDYFYYEVLEEFPETFLIAELNGKIVGYIMCRMEYGFSHIRRLGLARKGHVISVAVLDTHRGKGVGTQLMLLAQAEMRAKSAGECYLEVRVSNTGAVQLYQKLGYKVVGRLEAYYRDGDPAYLMAVQLDS